jgi:hypothetical protein
MEQEIAAWDSVIVQVCVNCLTNTGLCEMSTSKVYLCLHGSSTTDAN